MSEARVPTLGPDGKILEKFLDGGVLVGPDGWVLPQYLPPSIPYLDTSGRLDESTIPEGLPRLDGAGDIPDHMIPPTIPRMDGSGKLPLAVMPDGYTGGGGDPAPVAVEREHSIDFAFDESLIVRDGKYTWMAHHSGLFEITRVSVTLGSVGTTPSQFAVKVNGSPAITINVLANTDDAELITSALVTARAKVTVSCLTAGTGAGSALVQVWWKYVS